MPKCPKCKAKISRLDVLVTEDLLYEFTPETYDTGFVNGELVNTTIVRWKCPKCHDELPIGQDQDSALAFLQGEPEANWKGDANPQLAV